MSFFDDLESSPQENIRSEAAEAETENAAEAPKTENTVKPDQTEFTSADFWDSVAAVRKKRSKKLSAVVIVFMLFIVIVTSFIITVAVKGRGWLANIIAGDQRIEFTLPIAKTPQLDDKYYEEDGRYTAQGIAEAVSPSVVSIEIYKTGTSFAAVGQGSGIVMSEDGYILTNAHVVDGASKGIKVVLSDKTEYEAKIIGMDTASDIAVIKIPAKGLSPAQFGDSESVSVGEDVVTIGSPAGFYGSVTKGIVSGLDRQIKVENSSISMSCIQIDAAINPGNSGGALLNMWGQVIGITSSKLASSDYDGIGFAISINAAKPIIENLMEYGYVQNRVRVGITFYSISETTAQMYGTKAGIYVVSVDQDCDIANTQLQPDDIITEFDETEVSDSETVQAFLAKKKPGDTVKAKVYRPSVSGSGEEFEIEFRLMEDKGSLIENTDGND
ncbi:trypsin-like peptidase domain-containing protein [Hominimerdicola sp. 21CYCFAH17_S]